MNRYPIFLAAASVAFFVVQASQAADAPLETQTNWSGAYVGAHVGLGGANYDGRFDTSESVDEQGFASDLDLDGVVGGLQLGYNMQDGDIVYGIEADITGTDFEDTALERDNNNSDDIEGEVNWLATIRGRAGVAMDDVLVYGTAGIAFVDASYTANNGPVGAPTSSGTVDFNDVGYVVGGGVELMQEGGISFRLEGLYYGFGESINTSNLNTDSDAADFAELEDAWVVRAGVSIKIGDLLMD